MRTSRTVIHRLLDPRDTSVTLATLAKASKALGVKLLKVAQPLIVDQAELATQRGRGDPAEARMVFDAEGEVHHRIACALKNVHISRVASISFLAQVWPSPAMR